MGRHCCEESERPLRVIRLTIPAAVEVFGPARATHHPPGYGPARRQLLFVQGRRTLRWYEPGVLTTSFMSKTNWFSPAFTIR